MREYLHAEALLHQHTENNRRPTHKVALIVGPEEDPKSRSSKPITMADVLA